MRANNPVHDHHSKTGDGRRSVSGCKFSRFSTSAGRPREAKAYNTSRHPAQGIYSCDDH